MVEYGIEPRPLAVLQSATSVNARVFGLGGYLGNIKRYYLADIIVVRGDPSVDIHAVRALRMVMKGWDRVFISWRLIPLDHIHAILGIPS